MLTLDYFYNSKEWVKFRTIVINERTNEEGFTMCEYCHKPIVKHYDIILHHIEELTDENVNDYNVSLNPNNILLVHHKCHNIIHKKFGYKERKIYLIYGSPLSGKTKYVSDVAEEGDLIIDIDNIWQSVTGCNRYVKPKRLNAVVFGVRDYLYDCIKYRRGKWRNAYIIGGFPLISERNYLCRELACEELLIECSREECINRLLECNDGRDVEEWTKYIDNWFDNFIPTPT